MAQCNCHWNDVAVEINGKLQGARDVNQIHDLSISDFCIFPDFYFRDISTKVQNLYIVYLGLYASMMIEEYLLTPPLFLSSFRNERCINPSSFFQ
jgi:hypothetical protein